MIVSVEKDPLPRGSIFVGASKSISNRILVLKHMYNSDVQIGNLSNSEDSQNLSKALESSQNILNAGDGGTTARFLMAYAATQNERLVITGSERLQERPMGKLAQALSKIGVQVEFLGQENHLPMAITGLPNLPILNLHIDQPESSQFISALLMLGAKKGIKLSFNGDITFSYIQLTLNILKELYIDFEVGEDEEGNIHIVVGPGTPVFKDWYVIENDWSSASFWMGIIAQSSKNSEIELVGLQLGSIQPDAEVIHYFAMLGVKVSDTEEGILVKKVSNPESDNLFFELSSTPDVFPILATTCAAMGIKASFSGLFSLVHKESNRLETVARGLRQLGYEVMNNELDEFEILGGKGIKNRQLINSDKDHRIAMAFASMISLEGELEISEPEVVNKSYPAFWEHLSKHVLGLKLK